jgi:hypothetical protein
MSRVLVVGCSFLAELECDTSGVKIIGKPGAGNRVLAEIVTHELAIATYTQVYIVWSGINRIDIPIGIELYKTFDKDNYPYHCKLDDVVWYFSGGIGGSGPECPIEIKKSFHTHYVGSTPRYLTNLTLSSIISIQSLLCAKNISYRMAFIYNPDNQTYDVTQLSNVLGTIDWSSPMHTLVDWSKIQTNNTPYEWCQHRHLLKEDNFHPSRKGITSWLSENFQLDIDKLVDQTL